MILPVYSVLPVGCLMTPSRPWSRAGARIETSMHRSWKRQDSTERNRHSVLSFNQIHSLCITSWSRSDTYYNTQRERERQGGWNCVILMILHLTCDSMNVWMKESRTWGIIGHVFVSLFWFHIEWSDGDMNGIWDQVCCKMVSKVPSSCNLL